MSTDKRTLSPPRTHVVLLARLREDSRTSSNRQEMLCLAVEMLSPSSRPDPVVPVLLLAPTQEPGACREVEKDLI